MSELIFIANKIAPPGSGVYRSWDCSRVDCVLVEAIEIPPSGSGVNNSRECSPMLTLIVKKILVVPG